MKKLLLIFSFLCASLSEAQTATENYISTTDCLNDDCTKKAYTVQYFDLLGRPKQIVNVQATPSGKDIVTHLEYDEFGRQVKKYLPVPQVSTGAGSYYSGPLGIYPTTYGNEKIYSEKILEKSPLQRVLQQKQVGNDWNTKPVVFGYDVNGIEDHVKKYEVVATWDPTLKVYTNELLPVSEYLPGQLIKNTVTDEDENKTIEFKDGSGQTVLVRKAIDASKNADTYYVYNDYKQLAYVVPPLASIAVLDPTSLNNLCYQYVYDSKNRLVEKRLPGKGLEYFVYDRQDRIVATQDINLREKGQWMYTKYDKFGRIGFTGISTGGDRNIEQAIADGFIDNNVKRTDFVFFNRQGLDVFYDPNGTYPNINWVTMLSVNYYDTYPSYPTGAEVPNFIAGQKVLKQLGQSTTAKNTVSLPVASYIKNIEDDNWTKAFTYYDEKGRIIGSYTNNHLGGYTKTESELDFAGVTKQSKVYHKRLASDTEKVITQTFTYDGQNRLLVHRHQVDTNPEEILVQNEYNELSQIKNKKLGGTTIAQPLQSIDYTYNIRGSLTKINDPTNLNGKLFGYELKYNNPVNPNIAPGRFNGNIAEIDWKNASEDVLKRYNYVYDGLGRLKDAVYSEPNDTAPFNNNYNEHLTYDVNGNIKTLKRNAFPVTGTTATQVDDLMYEYTGNRLVKVVENALNDTGYEGGNNTISYDLNGNMKDMLDKGIKSIKYNYLNLSNEYLVQQNTIFGQTSEANISYLYRADGAKLRKTHFSPGNRMIKSSTRITDYLDGFQYSYVEGGGPCITCRTGNAFEQQAYKGILNPLFPGTPEWKLDFVATAEGFYSFTENRYIYQYRDHLGNTRVTFAKGSEGTPEIIDTNNYYPFGLNHISEMLSTSNFGSFYSYKYNGKELQETGMYDYGARMYMPDLGRWGVVDAMAEKFSSLSPYNYALNSPGMIIDPDGNFAVSYSGEAAQEAFRSYRETMSVSSETSSGNYFTGLGSSPFGKYDWVMRKDGSIYWDKNANDYYSTKIDEIYLGKEIGMTFNSYIDEKLWDGPNSKAPGDKLTSTIILTGRENSKGELISLVGRSSIEIGWTPIGTARDYYPGEGGSNNVFNMKTTSTGINVNFEQHASVPWQEHFAINAMGLKIVDVAQKLNINYNKNNGNLSIDAYTNIFPSATLYVQGTVAMQYNQPSFMKSHAIPPVKGIQSTPRGIPVPKTDTSNYPSKFYKRN
ncbi:DUF6443 domain-containing protein [Chryseobacterium viscerum]|uniref:RHS repeat-associated core domain-containing protein n=1 Tax=Chryseobacterium viscerum TaxID=1037377 RepID=A0A5N4BLN6_9FLAO|nr:DUF6443 domain-containing protein [Chryseobacterium viscerum]KAB1229349.1 RHS repeat-associated core domain-containing protein [Chryseobacterium viscerum]